MRIRDLMEDEVLFVYNTTSIGQMLETIIKRRINGLPVVDQDMHVVGMLTEGDIISRSEMFSREFDPMNLSNMNVTVLMTKNPITIHPDAELSQAVAIFSATKIKQLPVISDGELVGILSRKDIIKGMLK